jgi:hypothetical protein
MRKSALSKLQKKKKKKKTLSLPVSYALQLRYATTFVILTVGN